MERRTFKGRVITGTTLSGEAIVSRAGVITLATYQKSALKNEKEVICTDQNNSDLYGKVIQGKYL